MTTVATSGLVALAAGAVQSDDYLLVLDVHDTTQAGTGSLKKLLFSSLLQTATTAVTVSTPLTFTQTWSDAAVTFTGIKANITNTNSAAASLLLDLQVGGTSQWKVTKAGAVTQLGALVITGALSGVTALTAATGAFSSTLAVTGVSTVAKIICGDGTTMGGPGVAAALGTASSVSSSASGSAVLSGVFYLKQTAANSSTAQGVEGVVECTHTSGTVAGAIGVPGNCYISGVGGTTTFARGVQGGGSLTAGTVTSFASVVAAAPATGATVTTAYGFYAAAVTIAATNWAIYCVSDTTSGGVAFRTTALATTATTGYVHIPSCAGTPTGVPASIPTGQIPWVYDSSAHKIWFYSGSWRGVVVS